MPFKVNARQPKLIHAWVLSISASSNKPSFGNSYIQQYEPLLLLHLLKKDEQTSHCWKEEGRKHVQPSPRKTTPDCEEPPSRHTKKVGEKGKKEGTPDPCNQNNPLSFETPPHSKELSGGQKTEVISAHSCFPLLHTQTSYWKLGPVNVLAWVISHMIEDWI